MSPIKNPTTFFSYIRRAPFGGRLTQSQIDGVNAIISEAGDCALSESPTAYALATTFFETGGKMQPVRENMSYRADRILEVFGANHSAKVTKAEAQKLAGNPQALAERVYGLGNPKKAAELGNVQKGDGFRYRGGGLDQRTGRKNYRRVGLEDKPDSVVDLAEASRVMIKDMIEGNYTGKKLSDFFSETIDDAEGARRIINGTDKAKLIAGYHKNFLDAIKAASLPLQKPDTSHALATADDVKPSASGSVKTLLSSTLVTAGVSALVGVNNPWAFGVSALALLMGGGVLYMFGSGRWSVNRIKGI
ncbi:hypothetical protein [Agrobacterium tumefaciens]|uniref:hypothetical protein n=1 Tax=Agrobacterium tumefaciens TaxID=358 RepID=UPI0021D3D948|nr:hypothetical protein [Agrobacterium tumefaciens]UXT99432.1 hypothetical protein FY129_18270 [Agrobacterium tumefaciens]